MRTDRHRDCHVEDDGVSDGMLWVPEYLEPLRPADRCDRCSAQARVRLRLGETSMVLDMCRHHWLKHSTALTADGWHVVHDTLAELEQRPGASA